MLTAAASPSSAAMLVRGLLATEATPGPGTAQAPAEGKDDRDGSASEDGDDLHGLEVVPLAPPADDDGVGGGGAPGPPPGPEAAAAGDDGDDSRGWLMPYWRLLRANREYRVLFVGHIISGLGDWFNIIASLSVLSAADGSALALAFYGAVNALPATVLGPLIGVITDRYDKKTLMVLSLVVRALTVVGLVFCQTPATLPGMYVLTFIKHAFAAMYQPVRTAMVPAVVSKRQLVLANGLDGIIWSCMLFVGGAAGGFATSLFGITVAYILDGVAYLLAAYVLGFLLVRGGPLLPLSLLGSWLAARAADAAAWLRCAPRRYDRLQHDGIDMDDTATVELGGATDATSPPVTPKETEAGGEPAPAAASLRSQSAVPSSLSSSTSPSSWRMISDGFRYMWSVRYVFAICFYKGSLNLVRASLHHRPSCARGCLMQRRV
jgi:MFS family permease